MLDYILDFALVLFIVSIVFIPIGLFCQIGEKIVDKYNLWDKVEKFFQEPED